MACIGLKIIAKSKLVCETLALLGCSLEVRHPWSTEKCAKCATTPTMNKNTHKHTNTSLPALPALSTQPTRTPVLFHTNGNAEKDGKNFLLTKFVRREKKDGKDFTSCQKDGKNLPSFLGFLWVLGLV